MAAPNPTDKVKDKEYSNWLKVTLSLYYMKSGLHTFIRSEIDHLHQSLVQKVYGGQTVPLPPCTACNASLVNRNKFTGVWEFKKHCSSYCYVWLHELLKLHANPKSEKIYWDNSDVPSWPFKPWECAKVFMPRGQQSSNAGPAECDAQALLTLLASCTHFHPKLSSQGLGLTHTISTVRNKLMHDGEMKVSDADTRNYIQQIIQLLEDSVSLKSLEDCKAAICNIHKIENDSVDVFLNVDQEMFALKTAVKEVRQEFGMQEKRTFDTVESLKDEYRQLREQLATNLTKLTDVEARVHINERDIQLVKEQADISVQKQEMHTTVTSQLTERYEETKAKVDMIAQDVQSVKEQIDTALQQHETFSGSIENTSAIVASHGVRIDAVEENLIKLQETRLRTEQNITCVKETPTNRRPQSDGLRQLKSQTEDKLDSVRRLGFIQTKQMEEAKKLLQVKRSVVIKGNPGEGKTTTALFLIDNEWCIDQRVLVSSPRDWKSVDTDWIDIVILEDIFGQFDLDPGYLQEWLVYLPSIQEHVDAGKLQLIITTRVDILEKAYTRLGSINLFCDEFLLILSSEKLQQSEKLNILNRELQRHNRDMLDAAKKECIANFKGLIGFPQCCSFFAGDTCLFIKGPDFFQQPEKLFSINIRNLKDHRFLSLAFLFCIGGILEKYLSPGVLPEWTKSLLLELAYHLHISEKKASIMLLRETYESFSGLYVTKCDSYIKFSHYTVLEAVGCILGERSPEMVVKYCDSLYLNHRTYAAESKDKTSHNVFIPVSAYGLLAERIICEVVQGGMGFNRLDEHSAFKQHQFLIELKEQLCKCGKINDFLQSDQRNMDEPNISEGKCGTFLQFFLKSDGNTAKVVYKQFLEFLVCSHDISESNKGCWKCNEKKCLLELALYYNHLDIADNLITMNACLSPISLCNAAKHGNLNRVKTILESLKIKKLLDPQNIYVRKSLCRAFMSGNTSLVELLLKEGIELDSSHVICVVRQGDIDAVVKLVEYLKHGHDWDPLHEKGNQANLWIKCSICDSCPSCQNELQFSIALYFAYRAEKLDMAEFLLKEGVKVTMDIFVAVLKHGSYAVLPKVLQDLKDTNRWNPESDCVSKAGEFAYQRLDLFELLLQKEVSFALKTLPGVVSWGSNKSIAKVLQHLKHGFKWDPKSEYASQALKNALIKEMNDICFLLVNEGVTLTMDIITDNRCWRTKETLSKVIEHLRELNKWDPKSDVALETLKRSYMRGKNDMSDQLLLEGVTLKMSDLSGILHWGSRDSIIKAIHHLKDTGKWDIGVFYLDEISIHLVHQERYDVCDILIQEGALIQMDELQYVVNCTSSDFVPKAIKHLKDTNKWDPKCDHASKALIKAYVAQRYDVCDLLIHEGVLLSMRDLSDIIQGAGKSVESVKRAILHLKDSKNWDPKFEHISTELEKAYGFGKYNLCDLLIQEGVSLSMNNIPGVIASAESASKAIQHLKNANNWDSNSSYAFIALQSACLNHMYDVSFLLLQEGVSFTMKNILDVVLKTSTAPEEHLKETEFITQTIKHLKATDTWDASSQFLTQALEEAFRLQKYSVFDLLLQERISPTMKILSGAVNRESTEFVTKLVQLMKEANTWDPTSDLASNALELAFRKQNHDVCNLLIHEKVLLTMKVLPGVVYSRSIEPIIKTIQLLKDANLWDPLSVYAYIALKTVYEEIDADSKLRCDITDLLFQEGVLFRMDDLEICLGLDQSFTNVIHHLKEKGSWDPHSKRASFALEQAYRLERHDICDLLIKEGILLLMENLLHVINYYWPSLKLVSNIIQHLKDKGNWNPQCESATVALQQTYGKNKYDICDLLIQEGILPTMDNLLHVIHDFSQSQQSVSKVVQHLKGKGKWDPQCESASVALQKAYMCSMYDVCDLLIQEGIPPRMENLLLVINVHWQSHKYVSKVVQNLKDKGNWDPQCASASVALQKAYMRRMYDVCDLLIQEGIPPRMKNLLLVINDFWSTKYSVSRLVKHLKDKGNWDPHCESASAALRYAYVYAKQDVCDLLIQEGISLMMEDLLYVLNISPLQSVSSIIQHLKDKGNWDPHCESASVALQKAYVMGRFDICDLLIQEGILPTVESLLHVVKDSWPSSLKSIMKVVQHLKHTNNWFAQSEYASKTLVLAFYRHDFDLCVLLIQEGVSITIKSLLEYNHEPCNFKIFEMSK